MSPIMLDFEFIRNLQKFAMETTETILFPTLAYLTSIEFEFSIFRRVR